tara:strand:- start:2226 stop:2798 length:573 start_codon:yes stop_codon:yes gene_type:complete
MTIKARKSKKCKICKENFNPRNSLVKVCSVDCAIALNKTNKIKQFDAETRARKEKLKTRSDHQKECQIAFNAFIRARDTLAGRSCISCQKNTNSKKNAGHYRPVSTHSEFRFCEVNCFLQCEQCNSYLSGNLTLYRKNLIELVGLDIVEWLEMPRNPKKAMTIESLKVLKKYYRKQTRAINLAFESRPIS